jgi:hypothetical protein
MERGRPVNGFAFDRKVCGSYFLMSCGQSE